MNKPKQKRKMTAWNCEIKPSGTAGQVKMIITGSNTNGTEMEITVTLDDYMLRYMHRDMMKYANLKVNTANELRRALLTEQ